MATPIFIVGTNRSGTTWLANIISSHPNVAAIQSSNHHPFYTGVIESFYFSHVYGRYGDLSVRQNYVEFVETIGISDYFKLAGINKPFLYDLYPTNYESVFRIVMDNYAQKQNAEFWLEKSPPHSKFLSLIAKCYPDAKIISIKRDVYDVVKSSLGLRIRYDETRAENSKLRMQSIKSAVKSYYQVNKSIQRFSNRNKDKLYSIEYNDLIHNYDSTLQKLNEYLGLDKSFELKSKFAKNTSFTKNNSREDFFTTKELKIYNILKIIYATLPYKIICFKDYVRPKLKQKFSMFSNSKLPNWFYNFHDFPSSGN